MERNLNEENNLDFSPISGRDPGTESAKSATLITTRITTCRQQTLVQYESQHEHKMNHNKGTKLANNAT